MNYLSNLFKSLFQARYVYVVIATDYEGMVKESCVIKDREKAWELFEIFKKEYGGSHACFASRKINDVPHNWRKVLSTKSTQP